MRVHSRFAVCFPKQPLHILRPCFPGNGWASVRQWEVLNVKLPLLCPMSFFILFSAPVLLRSGRESNTLEVWQPVKVNPPQIIDPLFIVTHRLLSQNYIGWKDLYLVQTPFSNQLPLQQAVYGLLQQNFV